MRELSLNGGAKNFNFPASELVKFYTLFRIQTQDLVSLEIKKKRGSSIDLDNQHYKVLSSSSAALTLEEFF